MNWTIPDAFQDSLPPQTLRELEECLTIWAYARIHIQELSRQATAGAGQALALITRVLLGETPSQMLSNVPEQGLPGIVSALEMALKVTNAHFHYEETDIVLLTASTETATAKGLYEQLARVRRVVLRETLHVATNE